MKIFAGMKESSADGEMYGETSGKLILSYEDEDGQTYTAEKEISTVINPLDLSTDSSQTEEKKQGVSLPVVYRCHCRCCYSRHGRSDYLQKKGKTA